VAVWPSLDHRRRAAVASGGAIPYDSAGAGAVLLLVLAAGEVRIRTEKQVVATAVEIEEKVMQIVSEQLSVDRNEISRETSFVNDLNADSLDTVELVMELEDEFDLTIPDEEAEKLKTVGEAIDFIKKKLEEKQ
jgi:acyl carrier protein